MKHLKPFNENLFDNRGEYIRSIFTGLSDDLDVEFIHSNEPGKDEYYKFTYTVPYNGISSTGNIEIEDIDSMVEYNDMKNIILKHFKKAMVKLRADGILGLFDITQFHNGTEYDLCAYVKIKGEDEVS